MEGSGVGEGIEAAGSRDKMLSWLAVENVLGAMGEPPKDCEIEMGTWRSSHGKRYVAVTVSFFFQSSLMFGTFAAILAEEVEALGYDFERFLDVESLAELSNDYKDVDPTMIVALLSSRLRAAFAQLMVRWANLG